MILNVQKLIRPNSFTQLCRHLSDGRKCEVIRLISSDDVLNFARLTGDMNPVHFEGEVPIVHGALLIGIVSGIIGTKCPGPGVKVVFLDTSFRRPCPVGTEVRFSVEIMEERKLIEVAFNCCDANSASSQNFFMTGKAKLIR